jgi:hypothetical protein
MKGCEFLFSALQDNPSIKGGTIELRGTLINCLEVERIPSGKEGYDGSPILDNG